ncbi:uncharacterized protein FSUBG_4935 [Fusarium subglutinans]|uniref:Zn(2)-C6 fungal-type domain-containing protein n=1 Tax=Gibberella subglutinans TaxID=42677 RepID=A0A8H5Q2Y1_GIBSU|nr:uncharacterized protein FSUBG_4935 [Fusarium subglutinans]KAF5608111.1 hypothetical protein FSUBG_4935 [Fusarium subglutinans]
MAGFSQGHQRALLPAAELPLAPTPRIVLPRYPRAGVTTACETCRKRKTRCSGNRPRCKGCIRAGSDCSYAPMDKDHELRQRYEHLQTEKVEYKRLVDLLRLRDHKEANAILDMLRQNTSVHEVLRQAEHGDMLCELFLVSEDRHLVTDLTSEYVIARAGCEPSKDLARCQLIVTEPASQIPFPYLTFGHLPGTHLTAALPCLSFTA